MYILKDLWRGNISLCERYMRSYGEYKKVFHQYSEEVDKLMKNLSSDEKEQYENIYQLQMKLIDISETDTFIVGFRLGARMILDVVGEYHGQLKSSNNSL